MPLGQPGVSKPEELVRDGAGEGSHAPRSYGRGVPSGPIPRERLWLRAAALGIDLVVLAGGPLLAATVLVFGVVVVAVTPPPALAWAFRAAQLAFVVLFLVRDARGASPGKALLGLHVVAEGGEPPGLLGSALRNVPLLVPGWNVLEARAVLRRAGGRRDGDRMAGTRVVEG